MRCSGGGVGERRASTPPGLQQNELQATPDGQRASANLRVSSPVPQSIMERSGKEGAPESPQKTPTSVQWGLDIQFQGQEHKGFILGLGQNALTQQEPINTRKAPPSSAQGQQIRGIFSLLLFCSHAPGLESAAGSGGPISHHHMPPPRRPPPYLTFSCHGSLRATADGSSGSLLKEVGV